MSAIAGILGLSANDPILTRMQKTMARRGSGEEEHYRYQDFALLFKNDAGIQELSWAGERYLLIGDGELYNPKELREELQSLGHSFVGNSHWELVLHAYVQWQQQALTKLNGVFAFAIWEENRRRLFLARDRIGVKPLFYSQAKGGLVFASEIKTLLAHPDVPAQLDATGAGELLLLGPGRTPGSGVLRNIYELRPGFWGLYEGGTISLRQYWKLTDREHTDSFAETVEHVQDLVLDAIHRQMPENCSMGSMLSGGLDSSLIASVCAREKAITGQKLSTFSVDYLDNEKYFRAGTFQPNSDPEYIRIMQDYIQSEHHWTVLSPEALIDGIEEATVARDLPGMADVDISLNLFCRQIRPNAQIVMSGECADEIFGGYPWYRDPDIRNYDGFPWAQTTKERTAFLQPWIQQQIEPDFFVYERYRQTLTDSDILPGTDPVNTRIKQLVNLNFCWFMQTLLDRNDRMSSGSDLTVRVPLCDYRIAEYLYAVPWEMKNHEGREKGLLREAMKDYLPEKVRNRKKSPFPKTHHPRYLALAEEKLRQVLQDSDAPIFQLVPRTRLESLLYQDYPWPWYGQLMRRPQTIVYMLQINFWLKYYSVRIV